MAALREWKDKCPKRRPELVFYNEFGEPCDRTGIGRYGLTPARKQAEIEKVNHDAQAETHLRVHVDPAQRPIRGMRSDLERLIQNG